MIWFRRMLCLKAFGGFLPHRGSCNVQLMHHCVTASRGSVWKLSHIQFWIPRWAPVLTSVTCYPYSCLVFLSSLYPLVSLFQYDTSLYNCLTHVPSKWTRDFRCTSPNHNVHATYLQLKMRRSLYPHVLFTLLFCLTSVLLWACLVFTYFRVRCHRSSMLNWVFDSLSSFK